MNLAESWARWQPNDPPHIFDDDRSILERADSWSTVTFSSWHAAYADAEFGKPGDTRLQLGLLPQPFFGALNDATIFVLILNPGLGPSDYFGEFRVIEFRDALLGSMRQTFAHEQFPFLWLDPAFSWHGGFDYWNGKLAGVIGRIAEERGISFAKARQRLSQRLAAIELIPYHSANFRDRGNWLRTLPSAQLARSFIHESVLPRVQSGEAIVIATQQVRAWELPASKGGVVYSGPETRAMHLSPESPGGVAILKHMRKNKR